jgi:hypothetical protein
MSPRKKKQKNNVFTYNAHLRIVRQPCHQRKNENTFTVPDIESRTAMGRSWHKINFTFR